MFLEPILKLLLLKVWKPKQTIFLTPFINRKNQNIFWAGLEYILKKYSKWSWAPTSSTYYVSDSWEHVGDIAQNETAYNQLKKNKATTTTTS